jgi:hypothetical protein
LIYNVYSVLNNNITMTFKINNPINPSTFILVPSALENAIFEALNVNKDNNYSITIQEGTYFGIQLASELTNRFNEVVTNYIIDYFNNHGYTSLVPSFIVNGYTEFIINYNIVGNNMWFGNKSSRFILTNSTQISFDYSVPSAKNCNPCKVNPASIYSKLPKNAIADSVDCYRKSLPNSYNYGLPSYLGLSSCDTESIETNKVSFYYTTPTTTWLTPTYPGTKVYFIEAPNMCILAAPVYIYLEIEGLNSIDETSPFNISKFTLTTNETNGVVNSAIGKLYAGPSNNSWYEKSNTSKVFMPPAERIRKLKLKFRYHSGQLVDFNGLPFSILLEFNLFSPQQVRKQNVYNPLTGK